MFTVNNAHARPINDISLEGEYVWTSSNDRTVKVLTPERASVCAHAVHAMLIESDA
jgi:hypothetical protein